MSQSMAFIRLHSLYVLLLFFFLIDLNVYVWALSKNLLKRLWPTRLDRLIALQYESVPSQLHFGKVYAVDVPHVRLQQHVWHQQKEQDKGVLAYILLPSHLIFETKQETNA